MVFNYYARLSPRQKAVYRRSDAIDRIELPGAALIQPLIADLQRELDTERRAGVEKAAGAAMGAIMTDLRVVPAPVKVLSVRPSRTWGELHGLYEPADDGAPARITVWMKTAKHKRVVAFRTFLRTLLHELCHHLDYELYGLADSFHTEGFFKRESSLFRQLMPAD